MDSNIEKEGYLENRKIGNVILNYKNYFGEDKYSDGDIEDDLLKIVQKGDIDKALRTSNSWPILYHLSSIRENILAWYPIESDADVLEIGAGCGAITGILSRKARSVTCVELSERRSLINAYRNLDKDNITINIGNFQDIESRLDKYDYITLIGVLEYAKLYINSEEPYTELLKIAKRHLKENGKVIIAIENKMGIKYWNGATEDHTGKLYSGLNDYIGDNKIRTFSNVELVRLLNSASFNFNSFYYPIPDYKLPQVIYSDKYQPNVGEVRTYKKVYSQTRFYNFMEDVVCDQLCADKMFGYMSNSYVVIASNTKDDVNVLYAKYNWERKKEFRIATIIEGEYGNKRVKKQPLVLDALPHINNMKRNGDIWKGTLKSVNCAIGYLSGKNYVSEFIEGTTLDVMFYEYRNNATKFILKIKEVINQYLLPEEKDLFSFYLTESYTKIYGEIYPKNAKSLKVTNVDLLFSNLKFIDDRVYAFDFEWIFDFPVPYDYVIWRAVRILYYQYVAYLKASYDEYSFMLELGFGIENIKIYLKMENSFAEYVYGNNYSELYTNHYIKPSITQSIKFI